jgi:hypothetical protein
MYVADMAPRTDGPALEAGLASAAKETGGRMFETDAARALERIAQEQRNYYLLSYRGDDLRFDYLTRRPRVESVSLKPARGGMSVRARNGVPGEPEGQESAFADALDIDLAGDGLRTKLTPMLSMGTGWQIEAAVHLEARDVTFVKGLDGMYRATLDTTTALVDHEGHRAREATRSFEAQLSEPAFRKYQEHGFDYTVVIPVARPGAYQVRAAVRDAATGRTGSARQFVHVRDVKDGSLAMSSIVLRGEMQRDDHGIETAKDPLESASVRSFRQGNRIAYAYNLFNVAADAEKISRIETRSEIWRDGVRIYSAEPKTIEFPASDDAGRRSVSGALAISDGMPPGGYLLRIGVTDLLTRRTATQAMDFDVRP